MKGVPVDKKWPCIERRNIPGYLISSSSILIIQIQGFVLKIQTEKHVSSEYVSSNLHWPKISGSDKRMGISLPGSA